MKKKISMVLALAALVSLVGCEASELKALDGGDASADSSSVGGSADTTATADVSADVTTTNLPAPATVVDEDLDGDHYTGELDCDETNPNINHYAVETCNGLDDNCSGETDEGVTEPLYTDADKDGFGSKADPIFVCKGEKAPNGYVSKNGDCNDSTTTKNGKVVGYFINPEVKEECDGVDNNCDGILDDLTCPVRTKLVSDVPAPVVVPPATDVSLTTGEIGLVVMYADDATRTVSAQEYYAEAELGKWWTTENKVFTGKSVAVTITSKDACGERFSVATGSPADKWSCTGNGASATIDKAMTVYLVIPVTSAASLWINVTDKVEVWSSPDGKGCSAKVKVSATTCK